jgi:hypothetical protein
MMKTNENEEESNLESQYSNRLFTPEIDQEQPKRLRALSLTVLAYINSNSNKKMRGNNTRVRYRSSNYFRVMFQTREPSYMALRLI